MAEHANDDDRIASQIIEEEDLFFDDADDIPVDHLLQSKESSLASGEPSSSSASSSNDTLRKRLAGPSTNKVSKLGLYLCNHHVAEPVDRLVWRVSTRTE